MSLEAYNEVVGGVHPAPLTVPQALPNPTAVALTVNLRENVWKLLEGEEPENTKKVFLPKIREFMTFCYLTHPNDPYYMVLTSDKIYKFMFYVAFRETKKKGHRRQPDEAYFNLEDYERVTGCWTGGVSQLSNESLPQPSKPVSQATFDVYKATLRKIYKIQKNKELLSKNWDDLWNADCDAVRKYVKERTPKQRRANYEEKMSSEFTPYIFVERYVEIERCLWTDSFNTEGPRYVACALRHRYALLHLTSGILRCESLHRAELSDFCGINVPPNGRDAHSMFVMVNQIPFGKTNHGRVLYGRAARHKDVNVCPVAACSFYLQYRFHVTSEFLNFTADDWCDNRKWFDIKLLIDVNSLDNTKVMKNDSYSKTLRKTLTRLNLPATNLVHLGRKIGPKFLDVLKVEASEIQRLGNWNPSIMDQCYTSKLPLVSIMAMAGFSGPNVFYYNCRTTVDPPEELLRLTPIGKWVHSALEQVEERIRIERSRKENSNKYATAHHVLWFFKDLNRFFLQDAAAMLALDDESAIRSQHAFFRLLPVFQSPMWTEYCQTMKTALANDECPLDARLEHVIPGLNQWHRANNQALGSLKDTLNDHMHGLTARLDRLQGGQVSIDHIRSEIARGLAQAAVVISPERRRPAPPNSTGRTPTNGLDELSELFGPPDPSDAVGENAPVGPQDAVAQRTSEVAGSAGSGSPYLMTPKHLTLRSLYEEWYGYGPYDDGNGGVHGRERRHGSKWRSHINKQFFSRTKRIVSAIDKYIETRNLSWEDAVADLEGEWTAANRSAYNMVQYFQEQGLILVARPRGPRRRRNDPEDTENTMNTENTMTQ